MKSNNKILTAAATMLALHLLTGAPTMAQAEDPDAYGDDYQLGNFGRVQYQENGVTILRAASTHDVQPVEQARVNAPVFPGDSVVTGYDQRAELQLARGSLVRIDRASEVTFLALTDPYAQFPDNTILQISEGTIQISALLEDKEEFRIDTPAASIYLLGDGDFRIEVNGQGRTDVISRRGVAEVVGNGGSVLVRGGMTTEIYSGSVPRNPEPFNTFASDSFDHWTDERDAVYTVRDRYAGSDSANAGYEDLPYEVRPYSRELNANGEWVDVEEYGTVWHPSGVSPSWRPYSDGYWDYGPQGYFWVSNEPWGWAPYHYGRWSYVSSYGWCWIPGQVFGGAWVAWSWGSAYVGWAPLGYWNQPVWYSSLHYGYYDPHCWTFVGYNNFHHHNYRRYAVPWNQVSGHVNRYAVVTRPPRVSPRQLANSDEFRQRAYREASENSRGRMRPTSRERRPSTNVRDLERGLSRRMADGRNTTGRSPAERRAGPDRTADNGKRSLTRVDRGRLTVAQEPGRGTERTRRALPSFPRQISGENADRNRGQGGERTRATSPQGQQRGTGETGRRNDGRATATKPRQGESAGTNERVRDLYRQMSGPRTTREQKAGGSSKRTGQTGERTAPKKATPRRETTTRKPQSGQRSTGSKQQARPKRSTSGSGGSGQSATSRNNSYRPRSTSPRAGSSSRTTPRTSASGTRSSRTTPKASTSGTRSSRTTPKARTSGSSSRRPAPKAKSGSSRSSGSGSRARGSSSRGSSGSSGKARGSSSRSSSGRKGGKK